MSVKLDVRCVVCDARAGEYCSIPNMNDGVHPDRGDPNLKLLCEVLDFAFYIGAGCASGYLSALCGMGSRYNLEKADSHAENVRRNWPAERYEITKKVTEIVAKALEAVK